MAGAPKGNQNANKGKRWRSAIERALSKRAEKLGLAAAQDALDDLAEKFLESVALGDLAAFKEFGDRIDGKPAQSVTVSGDEDAPLVHEIRRTIVKG